MGKTDTESAKAFGKGGERMRKQREIDMGTGRNGALQGAVWMLILAALLFLHIADARAEERLDSWQEVKNVFSRALEEKRTAVSFTLSGQLLREAEKDNSLVWYWAARGGAMDFSWSWFVNGRVEVTELQGYDCPWRTVSDETEYRQALSEMRAGNEKRFVLLSEEGLFRTLTTDGRTALGLRLSGGLRSYDTMYTNQGTLSLEYVGCTYWDGAWAEVDSERDIPETVDNLAAEGYGAFALGVDALTWERLKADDWRRLEALNALCRVEGGMSHYDQERVLVFAREGESVFYPGYEILLAVRAGREGELSPRLRQTLETARAMLQGVTGTEGEKALRIHDLLCSRVTYVLDETTKEDDRCIGAILSGRANCDGYADAYVLLCGLAGIDARCCFGEGLDREDPEGDKEHLWNLVFLDGSWRGVDVTWDDDEGDGLCWIHYNMGLDRMRLCYAFVEDVLPEGTLKATDLMDRPEPEYQVGSARGAMTAVREASGLGKSGLVLWMTDELYRQYQSEENPVWAWLDHGGAKDCTVTHSDTRKWVHIRVGSWNDGSVLTQDVSTEAEVIRLLSEASGAQEIRLYLTGDLYERYRGTDEPVWKWLDLGGIREAKVRHTDAQRLVVIDGMVREDGRALAAEAESEAQVINVLSNAGNEVKEIRLYLTGELYERYLGADNPVWKWLDLGGVLSAGVRHSDIQRKIVFTEILWNDGSVLAAEAETEKQLIGILSGAGDEVKEIRLYLARELYARFEEDSGRVWTWLRQGGYRDAQVQYSGQSRKIVYLRMER